MTAAELIAYYASLLIFQYTTQPNAVATVQAVVTPVIMDKVLLDVQNAFDIDTAIGVQLDVIGKYVGVSRNGFTFHGPITLDDDDFRVLITLKIIQNNAGSSLSVIQDLIDVYFSGQMFVFDYATMRLSYYLDHTLGNQNLVEMIITQHLLPKPMGVQLSSVIYAADTSHFFGFVTYEQPTAINNSPYNTYEDYQTGRPNLLYEDALVLT